MTISGGCSPAIGLMPHRSCASCGPWKNRWGRQEGLALESLVEDVRWGQMLVLATFVHRACCSPVRGAYWSPDVESASMASWGPSVANPPSYGNGTA